MLASRSAPRFRGGLSGANHRFHRRFYQKNVSQKYTIKGYTPAVKEAHRQAQSHASQEPSTSTHYPDSSYDPGAAYDRIRYARRAYDKFLFLVQNIPSTIQAGSVDLSQSLDRSNGTSLSASSQSNLLPSMWQVARNSKAPSMSFQPVFLFNRYLIGALVDAPRHLRFRKFIPRFVESQNDIQDSLRVYKDLTVLSSHCTSSPEIVAVEASMYRIEGLWKPSVMATTSVNDYVSGYLAAASSARMTSLMKRFFGFTIEFYENLRYYQSEHMAMSIRQLQTNQVGAIHAIIKQNVEDVLDTSPMRAYHTWVLRNKRYKRLPWTAAGRRLEQSLRENEASFRHNSQDWRQILPTALVRYLKPLPTDELEQKRALISGYWARRLKHRAEYDAAMVPIKDTLARLREQRAKIRRKRDWRNEQGKQWYAASRSGRDDYGGKNDGRSGRKDRTAKYDVRVLDMRKNL